MSIGLFQSPYKVFKASDGTPLSGYKLYTYLTGTTTPATTYSDSNSTANANPIVLDAGGGCFLYLTEDTEYKFVLKTSADVTVYTIDPVTNYKAIPDPGSVAANTDYTNYYNLNNVTFTSTYHNYTSIQPSGTQKLYIEDFYSSYVPQINFINCNMLFSNGTGITSPANSSHLLYRFGVVASAVNYVKITNSASGMIIEPDGSDTNIDLTISVSAGTVVHWGRTEGYNIFSSTDGTVGQYLKYNSSTKTMEWGA